MNLCASSPPTSISAAAAAALHADRLKRLEL
uniref:Uncharacterized protein n=1 Tax=Arundo donax TaxID=35708 RepID=A0A0A9EN12_ARUDO